MKYKVGDIFCSNRNTKRVFKVLEVCDDYIKYEIIAHDQPKHGFVVGRVLKTTFAVAVERTRLYTKLDKALL